MLNLIQMELIYQIKIFLKKLKIIHKQILKN